MKKTVQVKTVANSAKEWAEMKKAVKVLAGTTKYCAVANRIEKLFGQAILSGKTVKSITVSDYHWNERINRTEPEKDAIIVKCSGSHGSGFDSYYTYVWIEK